jgi:hypothetical protein
MEPEDSSPVGKTVRLDSILRQLNSVHIPTNNLSHMKFNFTLPYTYISVFQVISPCVSPAKVLLIL